MRLVAILITTNAIIGAKQCFGLVGCWSSRKPSDFVYSLQNNIS